MFGIYFRAYYINLERLEEYEVCFSWFILLMHNFTLNLNIVVDIWILSNVCCENEG